MEGAIDEVRIYNRVLPPDEIAQFYAIPPWFLKQPQPQVGYLGKSVSFMAQADGSGPLTYQWLKDGTPLDGATNATLTLNNLATADAGNYSLLASNSFGRKTSSSALLTVNPAGVALAIYAGLTVDGVPGWTYRIEYTTSLQEPINWTTATNLTLTTSPQVWLDMASATPPKRFYRVTLP
jgi:hypothetical protein